MHENQRQPGLATLPIEVLQIIARKTGLESWVKASVTCKALWKMPLDSISNLNCSTGLLGLPGEAGRKTFSFVLTI
jgi:hypothetical protein